MKSLIHKILTLLLLSATLLGGAACSTCDAGEPDPRPEEWEGELSLLLRVGVLESERGAGVRAARDDNDGDGVFDPPVFNTEKMHTLRVIIVNTLTSTVAHNLISPSEGGVTSMSGLKFKVDFSTPYDIYLIANEAGLPADTRNTLSRTLAAGTQYTAGLLEGLRISADQAGAPVIDNFSSDGDTPVPMTEKYSVTTVDRPSGTQPEHISITMEKHFFITRALSKFSFHFYRSADYEGDNSLEIKRIRVTGLGDMEYLFPRETVYSPAKEAESTNPMGGRTITDFMLPAGATVGPYTFTLSSDLPVSAVGDLPVWNPDDREKYWTNTFIPQLYFPESYGNSADGDFRCSISFDGESYLPPVTLPNLSSLPRNTHVIVNITVGNGGALFFDVEVEPWERQNLVVDFTDNIGMTDEDALTLVPGTFASLDATSGHVVLNDYPQAASGSFRIPSPIGGRWEAYLVTRTGELDVIRFQTTDSEGNPVTTPYLTGVIDGKSRIDFKVVATQSAGATARSAALQVMVTLPSGLSVPVNVLRSTEYGKEVENLIFIQNPQ